MDTSIVHHHRYVQQKIDQKMSFDQLQWLYTYHTDRVRDFQHERLIHLIVTLFFSVLLLVAVAAYLWSLITFTIPLLSNICAAGTVLLLVTVLFYVRHYYKLENGVQRLYTLTEQLRDALS